MLIGCERGMAFDCGFCAWRPFDCFLNSFFICFIFNFFAISSVRTTYLWWGLRTTVAANDRCGGCCRYVVAARWLLVLLLVLVVAVCGNGPRLRDGQRTGTRRAGLGFDSG